MLRKNRRRTEPSNRGEDHRYVSDFDPRQHRDLLSGPERLEQQEETKDESNDAGPDHRQRANNEDEYHGGHRVLGKLAFGCEHTLSLPGLFLAAKREPCCLSYSYNTS